MLKHIIPMTLTEENAKIPLEITDDDSIQMELEYSGDIPMTVELSYENNNRAIAGIAIAGIAIAGVA